MLELGEVILGPAGMPACRCGGEMQLEEVHPDTEVEKRTFRCPICQHELKLMVWKALGNR